MHSHPVSHECTCECHQENARQSNIHSLLIGCCDGQCQVCGRYIKRGLKDQHLQECHPEEAKLKKEQENLTIEAWRELKNDFDYLGASSCGRMVASRDDQYFHVDCQGQPINDERYDFARGFSGFRAAVCRGRQFWHVRPDGTPAYPARYLDLTDFRQGKAWVCDGNDKWAQIDRDGNIVSEWCDGSDLF